MSENSNNNIGACWLKKDKNGNSYMVGQIDFAGGKIKICIFKNRKKNNDRQPDYNIVMFKDR